MTTTGPKVPGLGKAHKVHLYVAGLNQFDQIGIPMLFKYGEFFYAVYMYLFQGETFCQQHTCKKPKKK